MTVEGEGRVGKGAGDGNVAGNGRKQEELDEKRSQQALEEFRNSMLSWQVLPGVYPSLTFAFS